MAEVIYESTISYICAGQLAQVVQHWGADDATLSANPYLDAKDLADSIELNGAGAGDPYIVALTSILADDAFISSVRTRRVSPLGGPTYTRVFASTDFPGGYGVNLEAFQTAAVAIWIPQSNGAAHGRTFYPGVPSGVLDGNKFTSTFKAAFSAAMTEALIPQRENATSWYLTLQRGLPGSHTYDTILAAQLSPTPGSIGRRRVPL